jgi:hypothetical protein
MTVLECYQYIQNRLNKLSTNAGDNIEKFQFVEAFNACQLIWAEDRFKMDEVNTVRIDELQILLKTVDLIPIKVENKNYYEIALPTDYFHYKRSVSNTPCQITNWLKKEGDINQLLNDEFWKPSIEWGETICTIVGKKLRIYVDNFSISNLELLYYRYPTQINMKTAYPDANNDPTVDIDPEFQVSSLIEILNYTCLLLSGDTADQLNIQLFTQKNQQHT